MKNLFFIGLFLTISSTIFSQKCDIYFPLLENNGVQYQSFDRRNRPQGTQEMIVKEVINHSDHIEAIISTTFTDTKGRETSGFEQTVLCKGNEIILDIQSIIDQSALQGFSGAEVEISTIEIAFSNDLKVGMTLPDANLTMSSSVMGRQSMTMTFTVRNRVVEKTETIETPAGTFNCFKITSEIHTETRIMGINREDTSKSVDYWAPGVGSVRNEHYDSKDRLQSYMVLSKVF